MPVRPSVRMQQHCCHWMDFHEVWYWSIFSKVCREIKVSLKLDKNNGYFTWWSYIFLIISRSIFPRMRNVSDKSCRESRNTRFMFSPPPPPPKSCRLWVYVETYCRAGEATNDNTARAHCMLDTLGYKYTLRLCTTTFPQQQWLQERVSLLRLYVHCLSC
jgi:hypothetical protein